MARREPSRRSFPGIGTLKVCIPQGREEMELNGCSSHQRGSTRNQSDFNIPVNASAKVIRAWDQGFRLAYCLIREKAGDFPAWIAGSEIMSLGRSAFLTGCPFHHRSSNALQRVRTAAQISAVRASLEEQNWSHCNRMRTTTENRGGDSAVEWIVALRVRRPYVILQRRVCIAIKQQLWCVTVSEWCIVLPAAHWMMDGWIDQQTGRYAGGWMMDGCTKNQIDR